MFESKTIYYCWEGKTSMQASIYGFDAGKSLLVIKNDEQTLTLQLRITSLLRMRRNLMHPLQESLPLLYEQDGSISPRAVLCVKCDAPSGVRLEATQTYSNGMQTQLVVSLPLEECCDWLDALSDAFRSYLIAGFVLEKMRGDTAI